MGEYFHGFLPAEYLIMAGDFLGTSISGLLAFQRNLTTIGHNISNVNTPGYSRQRVELSARLPQPFGDGFVGTGVQVTTVKRIYDDFLTSQVRTATSAHSQLQTFQQLAGQVDNLLADPQAGLNPSLQRFFNAVNGVANDPTSTPARQVMLSEGQALADRFQYLDQRLSDLRGGVNTRLRTEVSEINGLASGIAELNRQIVLARGYAGGQPPNDLLDKRDALVAKLTEHVSVSTVTQDDGAMNIFIGNGQPLVTGLSTTALTATANPFDATRLEISLGSGASSYIISDFLTGGSLGGTLDFRSDILDTAQNALGRVAIGIAASFNNQHRLGLDLQGNLNLDFFTALDTTSPRVLTNSTAQISASITDANALTTSDYRLDYDGANYTLTRLSDNSVISTFAGFPQTFASEGLGLSLTAGAPLAGESFLIQPTRTAAKDIGVVIGTTNRIAAAAPIRAGVATDVNGVPTNAGNGQITAGSVSNITNLPLAANITLTFDASTNQFTVTNGPGGTLAYNPATEGGGKQFTFAGYGGISFSVSGTPADGDQFVIRNNSNAVSDNRNALTLANLRSQSVLANGSATYESAYGQMVADVGTISARATVSRDAQQSLLNQVTQARDAVSAVNLDEEAANLVHFQQAYQASAQMISVADTLFQTLIGAIRR